MFFLPLHNMEREEENRRQSHTVGTVSGKDWRAGHPLSVRGCTIMLCERGEAEFTINSRRFTMKRGCMALLVFDMVVVPMRTSDDFTSLFAEMDFDAAQDFFFLVTSNRFWDCLYTYPVFKLSATLRVRAQEWFALHQWTIDTHSKMTAEKVPRNEMENFMLVMAEQVESRFGMPGTNPPKNRAWVIINEFLGLVNRYYTRHHEVAFYAEKLNISPNYLNIIAKRNLGVTAKEYINNQLGLVVTSLIVQSAGSLNQVIFSSDCAPTLKANNRVNSAVIIAFFILFKK